MIISREIFEIADRTPSSSAVFLAHTAYGSACHFLGDLIGAQHHLVYANKHYREEDFRGIWLRGVPHYPPITRFLMSGATEWHLGYPDRSLKYMQQMLALARRLGDPAGLCMAHYGVSLANQLTGNWPLMLEASQETLRMSMASRYRLLTVAARIHVVYSRAKMGETNGSTERIREALSELTAFKYYLTRGMLLGWVTELQLLEGDLAGAMSSIEQALRFNAEELLFGAELLRLRGEVRLRNSSGGTSHFELAEQDFRGAVDAARAMSAKSDELRATTSLASLLRETNRPDEARTMLAEIYGCFTEGFDTADLKDAKSLLDELSR
jgi:hypothetical protein